MAILHVSSCPDITGPTASNGSAGLSFLQHGLLALSPPSGTTTLFTGQMERRLERRSRFGQLLRNPSSFAPLQLRQSRQAVRTRFGVGRGLTKALIRSFLVRTASRGSRQ